MLAGAAVVVMAVRLLPSLSARSAGSRSPVPRAPGAPAGRAGHPGVVTGGGALVVATHDPEVAVRCDRVLDLHAT